MVREFLYKVWKAVRYDPWNLVYPFRYLHYYSRGIYLFNGNSCTPDHILISAGLFDKDGFYYKTGNFRVADVGYGYSDHLPLLMTLSAAE